MKTVRSPLSLILSSLFLSLARQKCHTKLQYVRWGKTDLKTILKTDLANLRFLSFEKDEARQSILIMLRGKIGLCKPEVKKIGCVGSFLLLEDFKIYLS